jgi:hypothetical protein
MFHVSTHLSTFANTCSHLSRLYCPHHCRMVQRDRRIRCQFGHVQHDGDVPNGRAPADLPHAVVHRGHPDRHRYVVRTLTWLPTGSRKLSAMRPASPLLVVTLRCASFLYEIWHDMDPLLATLKLCAATLRRRVHALMWSWLHKHVQATRPVASRSLATMRPSTSSPSTRHSTGSTSSILAGVHTVRASLLAHAIQSTCVCVCVCA